MAKTRVIPVLLAICFLFMMLPVSAHAQNTASLTLICQNDEATLTGMEWSIYRVGSRNENYEEKMALIGISAMTMSDPATPRPNLYATEGQFADIPVFITDLSESSMSAAAATLETEAITRGFTPDATGVADENGRVRFSDLRPGLYLLSGKRYRIGDTTYVPNAILVEISANTGDADLNVFPKMELRSLSVSESHFIARKVWVNDEDYPEDRPAEVELDIYKDGVFYESAILNEENGWEKSWYGDTNADWRVGEARVAENYTVVYLRDETEFLIENTYTPWYHSSSTNEWGSSPPWEGTTPPEGSTTTTVGTGTADGSGSSTETTPTGALTNASRTGTQTNETTSATQTATATIYVPPANPPGNNPPPNETIEKLPQTGQLWWPVPILGLAGIILLTVGWRLRQQEAEK